MCITLGRSQVFFRGSGVVKPSITRDVVNPVTCEEVTMMISHVEKYKFLL